MSFSNQCGDFGEFSNRIHLSKNRVIHTTGTRVSYQFRDCSQEEMERQAWNVYESRINEQNEKNIDPESSLNHVKKIFLLAQPSDSLGRIEDNPEKYLSTAKILKTAIKMRFLSEIKISKSIVLCNNCFDKELDRSDRIVTEILIKLFHLYFEQEKYDQAFEAVEMFKSTKRGCEALLSLATIYLNQCDPKISAIFEAFEENYPNKEAIEEFLNQIENGNQEKLDNLVSTLKNIKNQRLKDIIIPCLIPNF